MAQIDDLSVGPKTANFLNGHSSETGHVKKKKKHYSRLHIVTHLCQFMGQNSEIWGVKKIGQRFLEAEPLDSKPHQTPPGCHTPPKMVPPYSLGTCPPTNPKTLWRPVAPSSRKHWLSEDPWFWPKYSNGPGVARNWQMSKLTSWGPRRCLKLSWDQIWQKNVNGKCSKLPKRNCRVLRYKVV